MKSFLPALLLVISTVSFAQTDIANRSSAVLPDLVLGVTATPLNEFGYSKTLNITVKNNGNAAITSNYGMITHVSTDPIPSGDDIILNQVYGTVLGIGASDNYPLAVNIPPGSNATMYIITIVDLPSMFKESNEDNNMVVTKVTSVAPAANKWKYDLSVTSLTGTFKAIPDTLDNFSNFAIDVRTANQGDIAMSDFALYPESNLKLSYGSIYLSKDDKFSAEDILLGSKTIRYANGNGLGSVWMDIPGGIANGSYYLLAVVDPDNYLVEKNEDNNTLARQIQIKRGANPDLYFDPSPLVQSPTIDFGKPVNFSGTVKNQGYGPSKNWNIRFALSTDAYVNYNDVYVASTSTDPASFTVGASKTINYGFTVTSDMVPAGNYYVVSCLTNYPVMEFMPNNCYVHPKQYAVGVTTVNADQTIGQKTGSTVFPNPANDIVNVKAEDLTTISIVNEFGNEVYQWSGDIVNEKAVDLSGFSNGVYFLKYTSSTGNSAEKLIVIR